MSNKALKSKGIILIIVAIVLFSFRYIPIISVDNPISALLGQDAPKKSLESAYTMCNSGLTIIIQQCDLIKLFNLLLMIIPALLLLYGIYLIIVSDWTKEDNQEHQKEKIKEIKLKEKSYFSKVMSKIDYNNLIYYGALILVLALLIFLLIWRLSIVQR